MDKLTPPEEHARSEHRQPPPGRQRPKQMLSCTHCRRKKLRCSRDLPACDACSRRGLGGSCTYLAPGPTVRSNQHKQRTQASLNERINQLEGRIVSLMTSTNAGQQPLSVPSPTTTSSPSPDLGDSFGHLRLDADETKYVAGDHWTAILDGIAELKDELSAKESKASEGSTVLLLGLTSRASREEILAAVPARPVVDTLVAHYFRVTSFASVLLHGPTFLRQYELFKSNSDAMSVMWIGLLFAVMAHGTHLLLNRSSDPHQLTPGREELEVYVEKAVQCLFLADYTRSVPFTMETLLLYVSVEIHRSPETIPGHSILSGIVVRVAMRMGYHRDPSHSPQITPFQAEMRRRHWAFVRNFDMHASAEFGLPRMINESACDTKEPLNLLDDDLSENMTQPPQPRPRTELTPMLFLAARNQIMAVFGAIVDLTTSTHSASYQAVMKLDRDLHDARQSLPPGMKLYPTSTSNQDPPLVVMRRIHLDVLFQKALCKLHCKYLVASESNEAYAYSRTCCIEAALQILQHQSTLYQEKKFGGKLSDMRWRVFKNEFLQAATILCLVVDRACTPDHQDSEEDKTKEKLLDVLEQSYRIWLEAVSTSQEAEEAATAIKLVLDRARKAALRQAGDGDSLDRNFTVSAQDGFPASVIGCGVEMVNQEVQQVQPGLSVINSEFDTLNAPMASNMSISAAEDQFFSYGDLGWATWDGQIGGGAADSNLYGFGSQSEYELLGDLNGIQMPDSKLNWMDVFGSS